MLNAIVDHYIHSYRAFARAEQDPFRDERSLRTAVRRAALCRLPNKATNRSPCSYGNGSSMTALTTAINGPRCPSSDR